MDAHLFEDDLSGLSRHYARLLRQHGDTPGAVQWISRQTQEKRMQVLCEVGDVRDAKILDFGCATGHLLTFLHRQHNFSGEYVGYDLTAPMIETARDKFPADKLPDVRFEQRDVLSEGVPETFDYIFISGAFNNRVSDNTGLMQALLRRLFPHARRALAFNLLSDDAEEFDPTLFYARPEEVFRFCKDELSPRVTLRQDYSLIPGLEPFDFTLYVYRHSGLTR